jgi:hypothetical protein
MAKKMSNFAKVSASIQKREGIPKKNADAIAASIGRKKIWRGGYGKEGCRRP